MQRADGGRRSGMPRWPGVVLGGRVSVALPGGGVDVGVGVGVLMGGTDEADEVDGLGESLVAWLIRRGDMFVGACALGTGCCRRP